MNRNITIQFTTPANKKLPWFSWLIRKFQGTPYSHVLLSWHSTTGVDIVYEASGHSVRFLGPIATEGRYTVHKSYTLTVTPEQYRELIRICMTYAGVDYGILQILGIAIAHWVGMDKNPLSRGDKSQVCSELVGRVLEEALGLHTGLNLDIIGPKELDEWLHRRQLNG